ncbi:MAG: flagella basal body P-ring formation protein FlgA [Ancrocorticia sp.]|nr:flagella basal body P-ring formation protein FlgA [Ancrocorticia sp.]
MFQRFRGILWRIRHILIALTAIACLLAVVQAASGLAPPTRQVVVSSQQLAAGSALKEADLRVADVPIDMVPDGALTSIDHAAGEILVSGLPKGMPLPDSLLLTSEFLDSAPEGYAVMPVTIVAHGTEDLATPGTSVALYAPPPEFDESAEAVIVAEHAIVVGHGKLPDSDGFLSDSENARTIFLAIPQDAVNLVLGYGTRTAMRIVLNAA